MMYKLFHNILIVIVLGTIPVTGQNTYKTTSGVIEFNASTPLENINPTNTKVNGILRDDGSFGAVMLVKDFEFSNKLMQEHFNENYMESHKYPKAYFIGKIENPEFGNLSSTPKEYKLKGKITIHNITQPLHTTIYLSTKNKEIKAISNFKLYTKDFGIKIPKIVFKKIAEEVEVNVDFILKK